MSDFKDVAHKTVAELFDMLKYKVAEIERKQAEIDLLKRLIEIKDRVRDEQQDKIDLLEKEIVETQEFLNKQNHIKQAKIDELTKHVACIKTIVSECDENTDSSWILGNIDGFIECMENILEGSS